MKCVICGNDLEEGNGFQFSNGEMVCKSCFEGFKKKATKIPETQLKEQIINQIFNAAIRDIEIKMREFLEQNISVMMDDLMTSIGDCYEIMNGAKYVNEYNKILMKYKNQFDTSNVIDFDEISYESKLFQDKLKEFSSVQAVAMLNDESFYLLHKQTFSMFPENEMYQMMFENDSFFGFDVAVIPYICLIRMIWMFHNKATAEQIFIACLRWSKQEKIKNGFMNDKKKYDKVVCLLKEQGPYSEKDLKNGGEDILKQFLDKLK